MYVFREKIIRIDQCLICQFYLFSSGCFRGPIQLPSRRVFRGFEFQLGSGKSSSERQGPQLHNKQKQPGGSVQQVYAFVHHRWDPGGTSQSWPQRPGCCGGSVQRLLQVGLQQKWDQLPVLRVDTQDLNAVFLHWNNHHKNMHTSLCSFPFLKNWDLFSCFTMGWIFVCFCVQIILIDYGKTTSAVLFLLVLLLMLRTWWHNQCLHYLFVTS